MLQPVCPECNRLNSRDAKACAICGASFWPELDAQPTELSAPPKETIPASPDDTRPAPQPDEVTASHSGNELTITWSTGALRRASAVGFVVFSLILLGLSITWSADAYDLMVTALLLLGTIYWLIAMYANRTILRLTDEEWVISRGPVPLPSPDFYYRSERRMDPRKYEAVIAVKDPDKKYRWGRMRGLADILFGLVFWLVHLGTKGSRATYTLYGWTRSGSRGELVTGLKEGQARYLQGQLMGLLAAGLRPVEEASVAAPDTAEQPASAKPPQEPLAEAGKDLAAADGAGAEEAKSFVSCPACEVRNPADSVFCGECGTTLVVAER